MLDFMVVAASALNYAPGFSNLTSLRAMRALRLLRIGTQFKPMRKIVTTLIVSAQPIVDVLCLFLIIFLVFAVLGLEMFHGRLTYV